ncbi:MAG: FAD/NAD(P)-binding protein [Planctomycetaceae bacterium]
MTAANPRSATARSVWAGHAMRIASVRDEASRVRTWSLAFRDGPVPFAFAAGQFNMLHLPGIGEAAISIASAPGATTTVEHTVRAVGDVTQALARLGPGDEIFIRGPFGRPWPLDALRGRDLVIVGGGVGLASLRSAILHVAARRADFGRVSVLHGAKTPADLLYGSDNAAWRAARIDVHSVVNTPDASWTGAVGLVTDLFAAVDVVAGETTVLCCGPEAMMRSVADRVRRIGVADADILVAMERNMACAAGICGLCQFGPAFVCKDGPVFSWASLAPFLAVEHL